MLGSPGQASARTFRVVTDEGQWCARRRLPAHAQIDERFERGMTEPQRPVSGRSAIAGGRLAPAGNQRYVMLYFQFSRRGAAGEHFAAVPQLQQERRSSCSPMCSIASRLTMCEGGPGRSGRDRAVRELCQADVQEEGTPAAVDSL